MTKEAYYFSHDSNARNDEKILAVRMKLGMEGYGLYWAILEKMRENTNYMCVKDYNTIAFDLRVGADKVKSLVEEFNLFQFTEDGKYFYSKSFLDRMEKKDEKSGKAKKAADVRWNKVAEEKAKKQSIEIKENASAMQTHNESIADGMPYKGKERKGKEKKERENYARAFSFLSQNHPSRFEQEFLMRYKSKINDFEKFREDFNDKVDTEQLEYRDKILFARLGIFARNWIQNQDKYQKNSQEINTSSKIPIG